MSVATELTRIQTAKSNIKAAIEAKGVSVPASATIDTYAALILEIPTSGSPTPPTPSGSTKTIEVTGILTPSAPMETYPGTYAYVNDGVIYAQLSIAWDGNENEFVTSMEVAGGGGEPAPDFTLSYSGGTFTLVGPWEDNIEFYFNYDAYEECREIPSEDRTVYETFSGDTMTVAFPSLAPMLPCQCEKEGGEWDWDHEVCVHPTGRTLTISDIPTPPTEQGSSPYVSISLETPVVDAVPGVYTYMEFKKEYVDDEFVVSMTINDIYQTPVTGYTTAYTNSALTISGPWGDDVSITYDYYDADINCEVVPEGETDVSKTFSGDTISLTFPTLGVNGPCQCDKDGGEWNEDDEVCVHSTGMVIRVSGIADDGDSHTITVTDGDSRECTLTIDMSDYTYSDSYDNDGKYSGSVGDEDLQNGFIEWYVEGNMYGTYVITVDGASLPSEPDYDGSGNFVMVEYDYINDMMTDYCSRDAYDCEMGGDTYDCQTGECGGV